MPIPPRPPATRSPYPPAPARRRTVWWRAGFALLCAAVGILGFLYPAGVLVQATFDPALNGPGTSKLARRLHESLAPRYAQWAVGRLNTDAAAKLDLNDVSGTEWPLYGSVFYLRAQEAIQTAWEKDHALYGQEPRVYARAAIEAASRLVADPRQAAWVKTHWGDRYLEKENVFYRMLLISALASHRRLTGSDEFLPLLRQQTDGLATELDAAPTGLLDDYPRQCYPTDIVSTWEAIQRADAALGTSHAPEITRAQRAFAGAQAGSRGLPPYAARAETGQPFDTSRGCANSNLCLLGAYLWPDTARGWYAAYERHFWQSDWLAAGFRELPRDEEGRDWFFDVDAGPVLRGNGFAACAFGVAAARAHGRFDHAYPLSLEMIALSWPLPGGRLLVPRLVSDAANAPLLGEAAILLTLTQPVVAEESLRFHVGDIPGIVWMVLVLQLGAGTFLLWRAYRIVWPKPPKGPSPAKQEE